MIMLRSTRSKVIKRDLSRCQACGRPVGLVARDCEVHHLDYDGDPQGTSQLVTLCRACHMTYHGNGHALELVTDPKTRQKITRLALVRRAMKERKRKTNDTT